MRDVFELVKRDLDIRNQQGHQKFGGPLTVDGPTNGGDTDDSTLVKAYEEALDLCVYLRKEIGRKGLMPV